jgi:hypothetical protein
MGLDQLTGRYRRLQQELAAAYAEEPWPAGRIDRLALDIAETERAIAALGGSLDAVARDSIQNVPVPGPREPASGSPKGAPRALPVARNRPAPFGRRAGEAAAE